jgi:hypothetical protein
MNVALEKAHIHKEIERQSNVCESLQSKKERGLTTIPSQQM